MSAKEDGTGLMSNEQKEWVDTMKMVLNVKSVRALDPPMVKRCNGQAVPDPKRMPLFKLVTSGAFEVSG